MYTISYNCPNARSDCFPGNLYGQLYEIPCIIYYVLKIKFVYSGNVYSGSMWLHIDFSGIVYSEHDCMNVVLG